MVKLGDIELFRSNTEWRATVKISHEKDKEGFLFELGPFESLVDLFNEIGAVTEGLIGFSLPSSESEISDHILSPKGFSSSGSRIFLTLELDDL